MRPGLYLLPLAMLSLEGCTTPAPDTSTIAVFVRFDQTDPMQLRPDYATISSLFDFGVYPDRRAVFNGGAITDLAHNPEQETVLPDAAYTEAHNQFDDITYRNKCIRQFNNKVRQILSELTDTAARSVSRPHSECFRSIATALGKLSLMDARTKFLLLYSDLSENGTISVYDRGGVPLMKDTAAIGAKLLALASLPERLDGIHIYLLFQPRDRQSDLRYSVIAAAYKGLLETRGATVTITASNSFNAD